MDCVGSGGMNLACVGKRESVNVEFPGKNNKMSGKPGISRENKRENTYIHGNLACQMPVLWDHLLVDSRICFKADKSIFFNVLNSPTSVFFEAVIITNLLY